MKYAIVESGGKQYRAVEGESIEVDRLPVPAGEEVTLDQVLLLVDGETISVGTPKVADMNVFGKVSEHFKGPKVFHFKYSPKKRIRVKTGHRQNYTRLLVEQIGAVRVAPVEKPVEVEQPTPVEATVEIASAPVEEKAAESVKVEKVTKKKSTKTAKAPAKETKPVKTTKAPAKETKPAKAAKTSTAKKPAAASKKPAAKKTTTASKTKKPEKK